MPQLIEYQGQRHEFPDGWSDDMISQALSQPDASSPPRPSFR
jgi:hypothetical protein